jgi:peptide chain release factor 1
MKPRIADKLEHLSQRLADLDAALSDPGVTGDIDRYRRFTREHAELTPVIALYKAWCKSRDDGEAARSLLAGSGHEGTGAIRDRTVIGGHGTFRK